MFPGFVSCFLSVDFSTFFSTDGLVDGDAEGDATGEATVAGGAVGLGVGVGCFTSVAFVHAPRNAAIAAKTVSRIDLLILFLFKGRLSRFFPGRPRPRPPAPAK